MNLITYDAIILGKHGELYQMLLRLWALVIPRTPNSKLHSKNIARRVIVTLLFFCPYLSLGSETTKEKTRHDYEKSEFFPEILFATKREEGKFWSKREAGSLGRNL